MLQVGESVRRQHGLTLHPGQKQAGLAMMGSTIAEMATGEGKTAAALLPIACAASDGRKVFVATANDYLAKRDAEFAAPVLNDFQCTVGCIQASMSPELRRTTYQASVVYGTIKEFVFDFLRDRIAVASAPLVARAMQPVADFLLIDEADSILIDDAVTPCIVSGRADSFSPAVMSCLAWGAVIAPQLVKGEDYLDLPNIGAVTTPEGRAKLCQHVFPAEMASLTISEIFHWMELAISVHLRFRKDVHYVVRNEKIVIVDESTGRISEGRQWSNGIHQAIEAREQIPASPATEPSALQTIQDYVRRFPHVSGMTGTATEVKQELRSTFGVRVQCIPLHQASRRQRFPDAVSMTRDEKLTQIISEVIQMQRTGRPVLIGTRTVSSSHELSERLNQHQIPHVVLNALNPEQESPIIAEAGRPGQVTVATNMAGRGTDIRLQGDAAERGGLHVIGSELHSARRIDRQLSGRCARQGDPGSFRQFLSLEDESLQEAWGIPTASRLRQHCRSLDDARKKMVAAQRRLEWESAVRRQTLCQQQTQRVELLKTLGLDPVLNPVAE